MPELLHAVFLLARWRLWCVRVRGSGGDDRGGGVTQQGATVMAMTDARSLDAPTLRSLSQKYQVHRCFRASSPAWRGVCVCRRRRTPHSLLPPPPTTTPTARKQPNSRTGTNNNNKNNNNNTKLIKNRVRRRLWALHLRWQRRPAARAGQGVAAVRALPGRLRRARRRHDSLLPSLPDRLQAVRRPRRLQ